MATGFLWKQEEIFFHYLLKMALLKILQELRVRQTVTLHGRPMERILLTGAINRENMNYGLPHPMKINLVSLLIMGLVSVTIFFGRLIVKNLLLLIKQWKFR